MRFPQYLAHFSLLLNLQTSKFWQKMFCTDQLANLGFPEEIDNRMKTLEKYDLSKLMQNLYVMNWAKLIWPLCGWGWVLIKHVVKMFEKLKQLKIWAKYESEIGGRCCGFIKGGQQCGIWAVERERGEDWGGRVEAEAWQGLYCRWEAVGTGCLSSKGLLCSFFSFEKFFTENRIPGLYWEARSLE